MDAKIDYISFTVMEDVREGRGQLNMHEAVAEVLADKHPMFYIAMCSALGWERGGARGHYEYSFFQPDTFAAIRYGGTANHILVELPGTACQALRDVGRMDMVLAEAAKRVTRVDIAVDIPGGFGPLTFVGFGYNERFKSHAEIISESGDTCYVGSMKSERYARVYMYNPPHPRAGTLRVEHVYRADYAKSIASFISEHGVPAAATASGNTFGWKSPDWQPSVMTDAKIRASRADRHEPGRVRWLESVVIPALVRAHNEGLIDWHDISRRVTALIAGSYRPQSGSNEPGQDAPG